MIQRRRTPRELLLVSPEDSRRGHQRCRPTGARRPAAAACTVEFPRVSCEGRPARTSGFLLQIVPYSPALGEAVDRLNAKLTQAGSEWSFPARERPAGADRLPAWDESFV